MVMTYASLQADIASYINRSDLTAQIPQWIEFAEKRIRRDIKINGFEIFTTSTMSIGDNEITRPARLLKVKFFYITVAGEYKPLRRRAHDFIRAYSPLPSVTGEPVYYADWGPDNFIVAPTPASAYPFYLAYYEELEALSVSNTTNWLTENAPQLLLYAALLEAAPFLDNDPRLVVWQKEYEKYAAAVQTESDDFRTDEFSGVAP